MYLYDSELIGMNSLTAFLHLQVVWVYYERLLPFTKGKLKRFKFVPSKLIVCRLLTSSIILGIFIPCETQIYYKVFLLILFLFHYLICLFFKQVYISTFNKMGKALFFISRYLF